MPLYEFSCDDCGRKFELLFRSMTERRKPVCPKCRGGKVRKLFSSFATSGTTPGKGTGGKSCGTCAGGSCATCH